VIVTFLRDSSIRSLLIAAAMAWIARSSGAQTASSVAPPVAGKPGSGAFVPCAISNLRIYSTDRLPSSPAVRTVTTATGEEPITMVDGYQTLYVLPPDEEMLNTKTEILEASTYAAEKRSLIGNLEFLAKNDPAIRGVGKSKSGSLDVYVASRDALDGGVLAIAELFNDTRHTVTTIYFLNAEPAQRQFQTVPAFVSLRDGILREFGHCATLRSN
jgi:hypothetical protein